MEIENKFLKDEVYKLFLKGDNIPNIAMKTRITVDAVNKMIYSFKSLENRIEYRLIQIQLIEKDLMEWISKYQKDLLAGVLTAETKRIVNEKQMIYSKYLLI